MGGNHHAFLHHGTGLLADPIISRAKEALRRQAHTPARVVYGEPPAAAQILSMCGGK
jgi:hypothetical protein